jgi:NAD-dependent deacetylase
LGVTLEGRPSLAPSDLAALLRRSSSTAVLTGAGVSTGAGIPDFRGPQGLYVTRRYDPERVFDIDCFRDDPLPFYEFTRDFMDLLARIAPTLTHGALAQLEEAGLLKGVVTQNIDSLHRRAGSRNVVEVHGSYWTATCTICGRTVSEASSVEWWSKAVQEGPRAPVVTCSGCGGVVKPDVVFFGEAVRDFERADALARKADLFLVLGSSLAVYPAATLPQIAPGTVVVVNHGEVTLPPGPDRFFVDAPLDAFFAEVLDALGLPAGRACPHGGP